MTELREDPFELPLKFIKNDSVSSKRKLKYVRENDIFYGIFYYYLAFMVKNELENDNFFLAYFK